MFIMKSHDNASRNLSVSQHFFIYFLFIYQIHTDVNKSGICYEPFFTLLGWKMTSESLTQVTCKPE